MQLLRLKCTRMHEASCRFPVARLLLFVCRFPPTPCQWVGGRQWRESGRTRRRRRVKRIGADWGIRRPLSSRSHPPTSHLRGVWGLTLSWCCVCLPSFPDHRRHQQGGLSSFGKRRNAAWVKSFKKQIPLVETSTCATQLSDTQHGSVWHPLSVRLRLHASWCNWG